MIVTLIGKNRLYKLVLPKNIVGSYWLTDGEGEKGRKLINIEGIDGKWQITNNNSIEILDFKIINREKNNMKRNDKTHIKNDFTKCNVSMKQMSKQEILEYVTAHKDKPEDVSRSLSHHSTNIALRHPQDQFLLADSFLSIHEPYAA